MAGIQTVDSSGKVALALMGIDNQIKGGQVPQARFNMQWLQNEMNRMKLTEANKKIQEKTTALNRASSDLTTAQRNIDTLTQTNLEDRRKHDKEMDAAERADIEAQSKQKFASHEALTNERIANIESQQAIQQSANKAIMSAQNQANQKVMTAKQRAWEAENAEWVGRDERRDAIIERYEKKIDAEGWDSLSEFEKTNYNDLILRDSRDAEGVEKFYGRLDTNRQTGALKTQIDALLQKGENNKGLSPVDQQKLFLMQHRYSGGDISKIDAKTLSSWLGYNVTQQELDRLKTEIAVAEQNAQQSLVPSEKGGSITDQMKSTSQQWTDRAGMLRQEQGELRTWQANPERAKAQMEQEEANPYAGIGDLPADAGTVEYFRRQAKANPTPENIKRMNDARDNVVKSLDKTATKAGSKATEAGSPLNRYKPKTEEWDKTSQKGTFDSVSQEMNANPVISSLKLPAAYKLDKNNAFDKKVGGFDWTNKKDAGKAVQFSVDFLNQLAGQLRIENYTPQDVEAVIKDLDRAANIYMGAGDKVPQGFTPSGVDGMIYTYANIAKYRPNVLRAFREQLTAYSGNQGLKEGQMNPKATDVEKTKALWASESGDFNAWSKSYMQGLAPRKKMKDPTAGAASVEKGSARRYYDPKTMQFKHITPEQIIKDAEGKPTHMVLYGERVKVPKRMFMPEQNIPVPTHVKRNGKDVHILGVIPTGTPLVINGRNYRLNKKPGYTSSSYFEVIDENGDVTRLKISDVIRKMQFPGSLSTKRLNEILGGKRASPNARPKKKPFAPMTPNSQRSSQGTQGRMAVQ